MKQEVTVGQTDYTVLVFIPDPASTDGSGKTGLTHADLTVSYTRVETDNDVVVTDATGSLTTLSALTDAHADWGVKEVSSTVAPGLYRLDIADAVFATGAWSAVVYVMITSSAAAASPMEFVLVASAGGGAPTAAAIADAVWDEAASGHVAAGTFGEQCGTDIDAILVDTGTTLDGRLPAALGANGNIKADVRDYSGTAGTFAGGRPEVNTSHAAGTAWGSGAITAAAIASDAITAAKIAADAIGASELAADAATEIVDALLKRDMSAVTGESARSPLNAMRKLMNKWAISGSTLTVYKEDDSTSAYTQAVSTSSSADPVTGLDTA